VDANADISGFDVASSDNEHRVDFHLLGALDFAARSRSLSELILRA
jgi:hypothetical protein